MGLVGQHFGEAPALVHRRLRDVVVHAEHGKCSRFILLDICGLAVRVVPEARHVAAAESLVHDGRRLAALDDVQQEEVHIAAPHRGCIRSCTHHDLDVVSKLLRRVLVHGFQQRLEQRSLDGAKL